MFYVALTLCFLCLQQWTGSCPKLNPSILNVHLVCHTHDDVGWLKTVDQYYWGANNSIQFAGVQYILDTAVQQLNLDPNKRFSYVEMAFFWRWWKHQSTETQTMVKKLVANGQLEFVNAGWVSNDEAAAHYSAIIGQMTTGLLFLEENFGECAKSKVAWQIDPFGHSREQAALYTEMGYDAVFVSRIHKNDFADRQKTKSMEMVWQTRKNDSNSQILMGVMQYGYGPPPGFCFDDGCRDEPIMDDPSMEGYNVDEEVAKFVKEINYQAAHYRTKNVMLTMGSDFQYSNAQMWFRNLDKLIYYTNKKHNATMNVFYSTPHCYVKALNDSQVKFPTKTDDFFPYASGDHSYWTGYFTSRPALKRYIRIMNHNLKVCSQISATAVASLDKPYLDFLRQSVATTQHHDAVSGTAKQHVTDDYAKRLYKGYVGCQAMVNIAMKALKKNPQAADLVLEYCDYLNETNCQISSTNKIFTVTVYNSLPRMRQHVVKVPIGSIRGFLVTGPNLNDVPLYIQPVSKTPQLSHQANYEITFPVSVPALGFTTYFITSATSRTACDADYAALLCDNAGTCVQEYFGNKIKRHCRCAQGFTGARCKLRKSADMDPEDLHIENTKLKLIVSEKGIIESIFDKASNKTIKFKQSFYYYQPATIKDQPSGAYVFRPNGTTAYPINPEGIHSFSVNKGSGQTQEIRQTVAPWVTQSVRLLGDSNFIEFEWTIGPIPVDEKNLTGKEIITRYETDIASGGEFYTDSNGKQFILRMRNFQPTYKYNNSEPVSGNYYPTTSAVYLKDKDHQLSVITDRAEGATSLKDGTIELMIHRRLLEDDGFGVGEPLNETAFGKGLVVRGKHWVAISNLTDGMKAVRSLSAEMFAEPFVAFGIPKQENMAQYAADYQTELNGLNRDLPENVNILSFEAIDKSTILLRLEHIYDVGEDTNLSKPVTIDIQNLFSKFDITNIQELTLGANEIQQNSVRIKWPTATHLKDNVHYSGHSTLDIMSITLNPGQIRTFRCSIK